MQMGYEYGTDLGKAYARTAKLYLCAFSAIYKEQLPPDLNHL